MKIYSKISGELLHIVFRKNFFIEERFDMIESDNFLQCAALNHKKGTTFKPHRHIRRTRTLDLIAQESWVVISGSVQCIFYDIDDSIIETARLGVGDASFTLRGGHTYRVLEDNTHVYEFKTGPYEGQELDKVFI